MIILISQKGNMQIKEILNKYKNMLNIPYIQCPYCGNTNFIKWGTYTRTIIYINDSKIFSETLKIQRVRCIKCKHTHALLPSCIVPYKQNVLDIILSTINNEDVSFYYSFDTLVKWNKQFSKFLPYLKTIFNNSSRFEIITCLKNNIFKYYELFFSITNKILMMTRRAVVNMSHF